jgi:hypothetical protein
MARYDRRDDFEHWVRAEQPSDRPCTHACCRGYRHHPKNLPTIVQARRLRVLSDEALAARFGRLSRRDSPRARRAENQVLHELQRRDDMDRRAEGRRAGRAARQMERESEGERIKAEAEAYTKGYLVTAEGRARGITDSEILSGRQRVFIRYATPEAKSFFAENPRPTGAYLRRGADTRVIYSDPGSRRR